MYDEPFPSDTVFLKDRLTVLLPPAAHERANTTCNTPSITHNPHTHGVFDKRTHGIYDKANEWEITKKESTLLKRHDDFVKA